MSPANAANLFHGKPTGAQLKKIAKDDARALHWEAQQLSGRGYHELAAACSKAAASLEKGLADQAKKDLKEASALAESGGPMGSAARLRRMAEKDDEPRL